MKPRITLLKRGAELAALGLIAGILIAGCGGGSSGASGSGSLTGTPWWTTGAAPSAGGTAVASYTADGMGGSFNGNWWPNNYFGTGTAASATAFTETLAATAQPTVFNVADNDLALVGGAWSSLTVSNGGSSYNLTPNGWALSPSSNAGETFVDSGDGTNVALVLANGAAYTYATTRTSLAGTQVACPGTCAASAVYPAGAASYSLTYTSNFYSLYDLPNGLQLTDQNGVALTSLPVEDVTTFCDPNIGTVYVPTATQMSINPNGWMYYVYFLKPGACTSSAITAALGTPAQQQVTITWTPTGVPAVPTVLVLTNWFPIYPNTSTYGLINPWFYSLRAGYVWEGLMVPTSTVDGLKNKTAINAELQASGYTKIP